MGAIFRNRVLRLANFGYFGHMWELYSMWGWIALLLASAAGGERTRVVGVASFLAIALGAVGSVWADRAADAPGNPAPGKTPPRALRVARASRLFQWQSAEFVSLGGAGLPTLLGAGSGFAGVGGGGVADSAQFSTIVSEVADRRYVGTALTLQTALGFLLTVVSIRIIGAIGETYGWPYAAAAMAIGPALGILAMLPLYRTSHPPGAP